MKRIFAFYTAKFMKASFILTITNKSSSSCQSIWLVYPTESILWYVNTSEGQYATSYQCEHHFIPVRFLQFLQQFHLIHRDGRRQAVVVLHQLHLLLLHLLLHLLLLLLPFCTGALRCWAFQLLHIIPLVIISFWKSNIYAAKLHQRLDSDLRNPRDGSMIVCLQSSL